jgi:hypothetical protein
MQEDFIIDEAPRQMSYLEFFFGSLGWRYSFLLPMAMLVSLVLILVLVIRGKGNTLPAALILIVPLPLLVGLMGVVDGMLASFMVIASSDTTPKPSAWAEGISMCLMTAMVGILLSVPGYFLAVGGMFVRSIAGESSRPGGAIEATIVETKPVRVSS